MDYPTLKKEILTALRGSKTQMEISQLLGYSFNQYYKWETSLKWLRWDEFITLLETLNIPYHQAFRQVLGFYGDPSKCSELIPAICANLSNTEIAQLIGQTDDVLRRWLRKEISPSVETIFQLIQLRTNNLTELLGQLVSLEDTKLLKDQYHQLLNHKKAEVKYPFSAALEASLCLEEYQNLPEHSNKWLANRILVSEELIKDALSSLLKAGTIAKKNNKYVLEDHWIQLNGIPLEEAAKVDKYWTQRALDRYAGPTGVPYSQQANTTNFRSFRVAPISKEAAAAIKAILRQASQSILDVTNNDQGIKTEVGVYVSHFFDVEDIHWKKTDTLLD